MSRENHKGRSTEQRRGRGGGTLPDNQSKEGVPMGRQICQLKKRVEKNVGSKRSGRGLAIDCRA